MILNMNILYEQKKLARAAGCLSLCLSLSLSLSPPLSLSLRRGGNTRLSQPSMVQTRSCSPVALTLLPALLSPYFLPSSIIPSFSPALLSPHGVKYPGQTIPGAVAVPPRTIPTPYRSLHPHPSKSTLPCRASPHTWAPATRVHPEKQHGLFPCLLYDVCCPALG